MFYYDNNYTGDQALNSWSGLNRPSDLGVVTEATDKQADKRIFMTDEVQASENVEQHDQVSTADVSESGSESSSQDQPKAAPTPKAEKMVPSSKVSKIVAAESRAAAERARQEALAGVERQRAHQESATSGESGMGGMKAPTPDEIRSMIQEEAWKMSNQHTAERILGDHNAKLDAARDRYEDFDEKYSALNVENDPRLILLTRDIENAGDVLYELGNNPEKFMHVMSCVNNGFDQMAVNALSRISASLKANEDAKSAPVAPEPLSQIKSSNIGKDSGDMGVSDFRKVDWLRG